MSYAWDQASKCNEDQAEYIRQLEAEVARLTAERDWFRFILQEIASIERCDFAFVRRALAQGEQP